MLQEQGYYPFGLQMAGISDRALGKLDSKNKFDGGVNFEEDYGVNLYSTFFRNYDPQIGRFTGVDALSEISVDQNSYGYAINDPEYWNDPSGLINSGPPVEVLPTVVVYAPSRNRGVSYSTWEGLTDGLGVYEYDGPGNGPGGNGNTSGGGGNYVNLSGGGGGYYGTGGNGGGNSQYGHAGGGSSGGDNPPKISAKQIQSFFYNNGQAIKTIEFDLYVKQPTFGFPFEINSSLSVGHSFIGFTITYSNNDVRQAWFGFYPTGKGGDFGNAQAQGGTLVNNFGHASDESLRKTISITQYNKIISLAAATEMTPYNLISNNCTTFAHKAANLAGIKINAGQWIPIMYNPNELGAFQWGDTPAELGQNILENNYTSTDGNLITPQINYPDQLPDYMSGSYYEYY